MENLKSWTIGEYVVSVDRLAPGYDPILSIWLDDTKISEIKIKYLDEDEEAGLYQFFSSLV